MRAAYLSYVGEAGWELTVDAAQAARLYRLLMAAGQEFGLRPAGTLAMTSMRIEKRYLAFGHDISSDETPLEAGLEFAVKLDSGIDFIGVEALRTRRAAGIRKRMVSIVLDSPEAWPREVNPSWWTMKYAVRAAYGYRVARPVCLGYIEGPALVELGGLRVAVNIAGRIHTGRVSLKPAI